MNSKRKIKTRQMAIIGVLSAVIIMLGLTPIGFIPIGPTRATTMHIPVILGAIVEGPLVGGALGLIFGLFSTFQAWTNPTPVSFVFLNPIVAIVPRVLMGILSHYIYDFFSKRRSMTIKIILNGFLILFAGYLSKSIYTNIVIEKKILMALLNVVFLIALGVIGYWSNKLEKGIIEVVLAAGLGTLMNTVGVLFSVYYLYGERFVSELGLNILNARRIIFGIGLTNGIPETILAIIIIVGVKKSLITRG